MKRSSCIALMLLPLLCACVHSTTLTPMSTVSVREHLIQQVVESFPEGSFNEAFGMCPFSSFQKYLVEQFSNLLSHPDAQTLNLEDLQGIFQEAIIALYGDRADYTVFYEGGDPNHVLAQFGVQCTMGHCGAGRSYHVFSRTGEVWHIVGGGSSPPMDMRIVDNGWVLAVNFYSCASGDPRSKRYDVLHVMQVDNEWREEQVTSLRGDEFSAPSRPSLEFDDSSGLKVSYIQYTDTLPCQFNDQIEKPSSGITASYNASTVHNRLDGIYAQYDYYTIFDWRDGMYVQVDQGKDLSHIMVTHRGYDDHDTYSRVDNWQDYCKD